MSLGDVLLMSLAPNGSDPGEAERDARAGAIRPADDRRDPGVPASMNDDAGTTTVGTAIILGIGAVGTVDPGASRDEGRVDLPDRPINILDRAINILDRAINSPDRPIDLPEENGLLK